nr:putative reverse transcriptase domain-containing protein [Tanacetum cinerariifolium]
MTTPHPTPFSATTPRARLLILFVTISDSDDEITTLPIRTVPSSSDRIPTLFGYLLDSGDDSSKEDLSETAELLPAQPDSTLVFHPPPTRSLPTSPTFVCRPGKEIPMPVGSKAAMDRWRAAPSSTWYPLLPSELPSSSLPPSLMPSSSSPSPPILPSSLAFAMQEMMTFHARVRLLEQYNEVKELQEFQVTEKLEILELCSRAEYSDSHLEQIHDRQTRDEVCTQRTYMREQDIEASCARAEAVDQRAETPHVLLKPLRWINNDNYDQWMSFAEIEQIVAQRVANAIWTIAIYEAKTRMARDLMNQVQWQEDKVEENASNKRKWEAEAMKGENVKAANLHGINKDFETRPDETLYIEKRSTLLHFRGLRDLNIHESHKIKYSIHLGSDKMYHDL